MNKASFFGSSSGFLAIDETIVNMGKNIKQQRALVETRESNVHYSNIKKKIQDVFLKPFNAKHLDKLSYNRRRGAKWSREAPKKDRKLRLTSRATCTSSFHHDNNYHCRRCDQ